MINARKTIVGLLRRSPKANANVSHAWLLTRPRFENTTHCGQNCATKAKTWCGGGPTPGPAPGPSPSGCETRNDVVSIALKNAKGEYSASVCGDFGNYRCDCSGFVSFVWKLGPDGPDTAEFPNYCDRITTKELKPGDAVLKPGTHVFMFIKWTDEANLMFEQAACHDEQEGCNHEDDRRPMTYYTDQGFYPCRPHTKYVCG